MDDGPPGQAGELDAWVARLALAPLRNGAEAGKSWRIPSARIREAARIDTAYHGLPPAWARLKAAAEGGTGLTEADFHELLERLPSGSADRIAPAIVLEIESLLAPEPVRRSGEEPSFDRLADSIEDELDAPGALENLRGLYRVEREKRKKLEELLKQIQQALAGPEEPKSPGDEAGD